MKTSNQKILPLNIKTLKIGKGYLRDEKKIIFFQILCNRLIFEIKIDLEKTPKNLSLIAKESLKQSFFVLTDNDRVPF